MPYDITFMWNPKNKANKQNLNRLIDTENRLMVSRWEGCWGPSEKSEGIKNYKLVVTQLSWECKVYHKKYNQ